MRRLIAVLSLLTLANLVFVLGGSACPLAGTAHGVSAVASSDAGHEGHDMGTGPAPSTHQVSADGGSQSDDCLTMGPCALTLDLAMADTPGAITARLVHLVAASVELPRSAATAPDFPPPRA